MKNSKSRKMKCEKIFYLKIPWFIFLICLFLKCTSYYRSHIGYSPSELLVELVGDKLSVFFKYWYYTWYFSFSHSGIIAPTSILTYFDTYKIQ